MQTAMNLLRIIKPNLEDKRLSRGRLLSVPAAEAYYPAQ